MIADTYDTKRLGIYTWLRYKKWMRVVEGGCGDGREFFFSSLLQLSDLGHCEAAEPEGTSGKDGQGPVMVSDTLRPAVNFGNLKYAQQGIADA